MAIDFKRNREGGGRMLVGFRRRDWRKVWYEPIPGRLNEDGAADNHLFQFHCGKDTYRAPQPGEVLWYPPFDPANHESNKARERLDLQKQTLTDAYGYLLAKDEDLLETLEAGLDDPQAARQYSWFLAARTWKKRDKRSRRYTRQFREARAKEAGLDPAEVDMNSDYSDDSGFEDGPESMRHDHARPCSNERYDGGSTRTGSSKRKASEHREKDGLRSKKRHPWADSGDNSSMGSPRPGTGWSQSNPLFVHSDDEDEVEEGYESQDEAGHQENEVSDADLDTRPPQ